MARRPVAKSSARRRSDRIKAKMAAKRTTSPPPTTTTTTPSTPPLPTPTPPPTTPTPSPAQPATNILSLPFEILSIIFEMISESGSESKFESKFESKSSSISSPPSSGVTSDTTAFLLVCRPLYNRLAPMFWQKHTLAFTDPVALGNEFLASASATAIANLQHLHYIIAMDNFQRIKKPSYVVDHSQAVLLLCREVHKFGEVLSCYRPELANLQSLTVELFVDRWMSRLILDHFGDDEAVIAQLSASQYWGCVDNICHGSFGKLETSVRRCFLGKGRKGGNFHITASVETEDLAAMAKNALWAVHLQYKTRCRKLILAFGRSS